MKLHIVDILIICAYLMVIVAIGLFLKKKAAKNMDSYFLGGKSLPFYMLGLSNASGMFDITGTMLMVYWAFAYGFKSLWIPWLWPVFNQIFLMVYLSVWLRRSNVLTGAEWIKTRFGQGRGATLSHTIVIVFALLSVLGFLSYGFIGIGKFMEIFFPWEVVSQYVPWDIPVQYVPHFYGIFFTAIATFYVMLGGMLSIVWTDVVQFPAPNYDMQKILSCKSPKEAALMSGSVSVILLIPRYLMIMGFALLAIYFFKVDGGLEQMTAVHTDFETILPHLITKYVPVGLAGLLLAGLLSAFMSTFASTVNAAPAYVVNDIYLKYINPRASVRTQIRASYLVSVLVVVISTVMGFFLKDINEIFQWIVGALFGGYIAANVLKWHWWRFNGEGYFWGMTSGVVAAIVMKFTVPDSLVLYFFPVLFGISLVGCIVGTYSAPPTDEETLVNFYIRVRPWGWWKPVAAKAVARYPQVTRNRHFKRDMFNVAIGIVWQCCLTIVPMYLVVRGTGGLIASVLLLVVTTVVLKYTWYRPLCREEKEYDELMKRIGMD